jgi:hypothetical protein
MEACLEKVEATDLEVNPEETESELEHQEIPNEEAVVKTFGSLKKQYGDQHQGYGGSQKKLAVACKWMTCHAIPASHKGRICQGPGRDSVARGATKGQTLEEMTDEPRMQQGNKGPRHKSLAMSRKPEGIQQSPQTNCWTGGHEVSSQVFH